MKSDTVNRRVLAAPRFVLSVLGLVVALAGLVAFLEVNGILHLAARRPAIGRVLEPLDEWRQISVLLLAAWAVTLQFLLPGKRSADRLPIRQGLAEADSRNEERRPWAWMLLWSAVFVMAWVGLLEWLSRGPMSPEGRVLCLAGAVLAQSIVIFWLLRYAGKRQQRLIESHWDAERVPCRPAVQALLTPGVGFLLGVGTLGLWVGLFLGVSQAWPQTIGLPVAAEAHASLLAVMSLAVDEVLDTVFFGVPALYGLVLGQPQPHAWIGATVLVAFRAAIVVPLFLMLTHTIKARRTYATLIGRMLSESSEQASETLLRIGRPVGRRLVREALRLCGSNDPDAADSRAGTLLLRTLYGFYHPRTLVFARWAAMNAETSARDRVEALKYVCTYGDRQAALDLVGQFFQSENPDLREGVSLICVAFEHPDCNKFLEEIGRYPHTPGEYRNAVIGAGLRLTVDLRDSDGLNACLEALPNLLVDPDGAAARMMDAVSLLAGFAAKEVKAEIEGAWPKVPGATRLHCLEILLKIRAGLLPDPDLLDRALSDSQSPSDKAEIGELWKFMTQAGVTSLVEIARDTNPLARDGALETLSQLQVSRPDLSIDPALLATMMAPADDSDRDDAEPEPEPVPTEMVPDPETHLVSL